MSPIPSFVARLHSAGAAAGDNDFYASNPTSGPNVQTINHPVVSSRGIFGCIMSLYEGTDGQKVLLICGRQSSTQSDFIDAYIYERQSLGNWTYQSSLDLEDQTYSTVGAILPSLYFHKRNPSDSLELIVAHRGTGSNDVIKRYDASDLTNLTLIETITTDGAIDGFIAVYGDKILYSETSNGDAGDYSELQYTPGTDSYDTFTFRNFDSEAAGYHPFGGAYCVLTASFEPCHFLSYIDGEGWVAHYLRGNISNTQHRLEINKLDVDATDYEVFANYSGVSANLSGRLGAFSRNCDRYWELVTTQNSTTASPYAIYDFDTTTFASTQLLTGSFTRFTSNGADAAHAKFCTDDGNNLLLSNSSRQRVNVLQYDPNGPSFSEVFNKGDGAAFTTSNANFGRDVIATRSMEEIIVASPYTGDKGAGVVNQGGFVEIYYG